MTRGPTIDEAAQSPDTLVGLARAAASKPLPRADVDAKFYLDQALEKLSKPQADKLRHEMEDLFTKSMPARIARVQEVIKKYQQHDSAQARDQLTWYTQELARLKEWQRKR